MFGGYFVAVMALMSHGFAQSGFNNHPTTVITPLSRNSTASHSLDVLATPFPSNVTALANVTVSSTLPPPNVTIPSGFASSATSSQALVEVRTSFVPLTLTATTTETVTSILAHGSICVAVTYTTTEHATTTEYRTVSMLGSVASGDYLYQVVSSSTTWLNRPPPTTETDVSTEYTITTLVVEPSVEEDTITVTSTAHAYVTKTVIHTPATEESTSTTTIEETITLTRTVVPANSTVTESSSSEDLTTTVNITRTEQHTQRITLTRSATSTSVSSLSDEITAILPLAHVSVSQSRPVTFYTENLTTSTTPNATISPLWSNTTRSSFILNTSTPLTDVSLSSTSVFGLNSTASFPTLNVTASGVFPLPASGNMSTSYSFPTTTSAKSTYVSMSLNSTAVSVQSLTTTAVILSVNVTTFSGVGSTAEVRSTSGSASTSTKSSPELITSAVLPASVRNTTTAHGPVSNSPSSSKVGVTNFSEALPVKTFSEASYGTVVKGSLVLSTPGMAPLETVLSSQSSASFNLDNAESTTSIPSTFVTFKSLHLMFESMKTQLQNRPVDKPAETGS